MVVMLMPYFLLIPGLLTADLDLFGYAGLAKEVQISLHRGKSYLRVLPGNVFVQLAGCNMPSRGQESLDYRVTLSCLPQTLVPNVDRKYLSGSCAIHINDNDNHLKKLCQQKYYCMLTDCTQIVPNYPDRHFTKDESHSYCFMDIF